MIVEWQSVVVLSLVAAAAVYVARRAWRTIVERKAAGCGGCGTCGAAKQAQPVSIIGVDQLVPSTDTAARAPRNGAHIG
jgi:hypothetical protein